MKKGLKRLALTALAIIVLVALIDFASGIILDRKLPQIAASSDLGKLQFALYQVHSPCIIVGSSRAAHHYVTSSIQDSLNRLTYNIGIDGAFIANNICLINTLLDRYHPQLIIWEVHPNHFYTHIDQKHYLLYPYFHSNQHVHNLLSLKLSHSEQIKLSSNLYRYNSNILRILLSSPAAADTLLGYEPITPNPRNFPTSLDQAQLQATQIDTTLLTAFKHTIARIQSLNIPVIVVNSPAYEYPVNHPALSALHQLSAQMQFPFLDNSAIFLSYPQYFNDAGHLNHDGAQVYTQYFISQIIPILNP